MFDRRLRLTRSRHDEMITQQDKLSDNNTRSETSVVRTIQQ